MIFTLKPKALTLALALALYFMAIFPSLTCNDLQPRECSVAIADTCVHACGTNPVKLTASKGTIFSPGYDQEKYPNHALCRWLIEAPAGKVRHKICHCKELDR